MTSLALTNPVQNSPAVTYSEQPHRETIILDYWQYFSFIRAAKAYYRHIAKQARANSKHRHTYKAYKGNLKFFLRWLKGRGNPFPTPEVMDKYVVYLKEKKTKQGQPLADTTIGAYLTVARIFLGFLAEAAMDIPMIYSEDSREMLMALQLENKINKQVQLLQRAAKVENPPPATTTEEAPLDQHGNWLSQEEASAILNKIDRSTWVGQRDYAFMMLGFYSALRLDSLSQVTLSKFKRHSGNTWLIKDIVHKRGKVYPVTVDAVAVRAVFDYVEFYNSKLASDDPRRIGPNDPLWRRQTKGGNLFTDPEIACACIGNDGLRDIVEQRGRAAELKINPHDMRRSWAAWARAEKVQTGIASVQMGHSSEEQTKEYMGELVDYTPLNIANYPGFALTSMLNPLAQAA